MEPIIIVAFVLSFLTSVSLMPLWIRKAREIGLIWDDMNKMNSPKVAGSGGIIVVLSFLIGIFTYIAYRTFYLKTSSYLVEMLSLIVVVLIVSTIGLIDDLLGWQRGGLSKKARILLVFLAAIPLIVINAGKSLITIPFLGAVDMGFFYPLLLVPLGIVGAATTFNMLAGFNGLEAGQGIILLGALSLVAYMTGNAWISVMALCMVLSLVGFMFYNRFPAKVFPGDSLTLVIGAMVAMMAIFGNFEKIAVFFFIPYVLEVALKSRGRLKKQSFGKPKEGGVLELRYEKLYGLEHIAIFMLNKSGIHATERRVVYLIWAFQLFIVLIGFMIFGQGLIK